MTLQKLINSFLASNKFSKEDLVCSLGRQRAELLLEGGLPIDYAVALKISGLTDLPVQYVMSLA